MISQRVRNRFVAQHGEPANLDELGLALVNHVNNLGASSKGRDKDQRVLGLVWNISSGEQCNSHNSPVGIPSSFRDPDRFPAFYGRVWLRLAKAPGWSATDYFEGSCCHLGSGGGGSYDGPWDQLYTTWHQQHRRWRTRVKPDYPEPNLYSWTFTVWLQDWPLIEKHYGKLDMLDMIKGVRVDYLKRNHTFAYEAEGIDAADGKYIQQYANTDYSFWRDKPVTEIYND